MERHTLSIWGKTATDNTIRNVVSLPEEEVIARELKLLSGKQLFDIEVSSLCNVWCIFCPRDKITRPIGLMSKDTFEAVARWVPPGSEAIISGLGEPLLNPYIAEYVRALRNKNIGVSMITNGLMLTPDKAQSLMDAGINEIQISIHSLNEERYGAIMKGSSLGKVLDNLEYIYRYKPASMKVRVNQVISNENADEAEAVRKYAESREFIYFPRRKHSRGGSVRNDLALYPKFKSCGTFAKVTYIAWNGDVHACSNDINGHLSMGNVFDNEYLKISDKKMQMITAGMNNVLCEQCDDDYRYFILDKVSVN